MCFECVQCGFSNFCAARATNKKYLILLILVVLLFKSILWSKHASHLYNKKSMLLQNMYMIKMMLSKTFQVLFPVFEATRSMDATHGYIREARVRTRIVEIYVYIVDWMWSFDLREARVRTVFFLSFDIVWFVIGVLSLGLKFDFCYSLWLLIKKLVFIISFWPFSICHPGP